MTPENQELKNKVHAMRNEIKQCPFCNSPIADRRVSLYKELIDALYRVYCWCGKNKRHEFEMKDVRDLLGKMEYARFGDFVRFGGLIYRPKVEGKSKRGMYGLNMARSKEFFAGTRDIPVQIILDQITNEIISEVRCKVNDFPELSRLIGKEGLYDYEKDLQRELYPSTTTGTIHRPA